jgi:DNA invertase Pin-like site-specific DNA recombinase
MATRTHKPLAAVVRSSDGVKERQADGTYHADVEQIEEIDAYADELGRGVVFMEPEADVSGGLPIDDRPALREAIEGVERGEYGGVIVAYLSRLSRSRSGLEIWDRIESAGGRVYTAQERLDTSTARGRHQRDVELAAAVYERERHAERFARRRRKTVEAGVWRQHQLPRGYVFKGPANGDGKFKGLARQLVPGPQADEIRTAARDLIAGVPIVQIAQQLKMTPAGVRYMLRSRTYLGELRDGPTVNLAAHEPILTPDVFDAVQVALSGNPRPSRRVGDGPALLAGIARCAGCGNALTRKTTKRVLYACPVHHSGGDCPAAAAITAHLLDEYVKTLALKRYETVSVRGDAPSDVAGAVAKLAEAKAGRSALMRAILAAGMAETEAVEELREADELVTQAERQLRSARSRSLAPVALPGGEAYKRLSPAGRNAALRGLIDRIVVTRAGRGRRVPLDDRVRVVFHD